MPKFDVRCCVPAWLSFSLVVDADSEEEARKLAMEKVTVDDLDGSGYDLQRLLTDPYVGPMNLPWLQSDQPGEGAHIAEDEGFVGCVGSEEDGGNTVAVLVEDITEVKHG